MELSLLLQAPDSKMSDALGISTAREVGLSGTLASIGELVLFWLGVSNRCLRFWESRGNARDSEHSELPDTDQEEYASSLFRQRLH